LRNVRISIGDETARALGHPVQEASIDAATIAGAREAFITSSLLGIAPLSRIDGRALEEGDLCRSLRAAYRDLSE
jgi:branched-subunit amino acid aminotransferase/4-amino-4-deoxychorismate lyase